MLSTRCTVILNYEKISKDLQRIIKIKPFINKYNWEGISFPSSSIYIEETKTEFSILFILIVCQYIKEVKLKFALKCLTKQLLHKSKFNRHLEHKE